MRSRFFAYAKKGTGQLRSNCAADQRLCFRYTDNTIPLLSKSEISILKPSSVAVQPGLCLAWSKTPKTCFLTTRLILFFLQLIIQPVLNYKKTATGNLVQHRFSKSPVTYNSNQISFPWSATNSKNYQHLSIWPLDMHVYLYTCISLNDIMCSS